MSTLAVYKLGIKIMSPPSTGPGGAGLDQNFIAIADLIESAQSGIAGKIAYTRTINTNAPLSGGGDLSSDRTITISAATSSNAGSMSSADKAKLDAITGSGNLNDAANLTTGALPLGRLSGITDSQISSSAAIQSTKISGLGTMAAQSASSVAITGGTITGLATPTQSSDAATKGYADALKQGLDIKDSCRVVATGNLTLSGTQTIDSVSVVANDRVLCIGQTTASQNGIYVVASGAWARSSDANTSGNLTTGAFTFIEQGTVGTGNGYVLTTAAPITLDTTSLTFTQFSGAGAITANGGLSKSGNTISLASVTGNSIKGNNTGSPAAPIDLSAAQVRTLLGLAASATTDTTDASNITSGQLANARTTATSAVVNDAIVARNADGQIFAPGIRSDEDVTIYLGSPENILDVTGGAEIEGALSVDGVISGDGSGITNLALPHLSVYGAGTSYNLTNTAAAVTLGTTSPSLTITSAGTWLLFTTILLNGGGSQDPYNLTLKLRRTNNTAADVSNSATTYFSDLGNSIGSEEYDFHVTLPPVIYTTSNTNDAIALFGNYDAGGAIVKTASIVAVKIG